MRTLAIIIGLVFLIVQPQTIGAQEKGVPPITILRAEEDYSFLQDQDSTVVFLQPLKWITLSPNNSTALTLGGEYRPRVEHFTNRNYTPEDETFYSQRLSLHAALRLGGSIRLFGELYHGYVSEGTALLESDDLDLHQGFLEWKVMDTGAKKTVVRLGRQEVGFGASRLVGIREGPNMRRTFDMARVRYQSGGTFVNAFYGREVAVGPDAFDNKSQIFDDEPTTPGMWGLYVQNLFSHEERKIDLYYFGFSSNLARFNDVVGEERRHTIGARSYGKINRFSYNTELIFQFGELGNSPVTAYNFEADWQYILHTGKWKPTIGLRLDWSSGDSEVGDDKVQTFNPFFVNPALYSLAAVNTPANSTSLHPNFTVYPAEGISIFVDYALFYRTQANDGLYAPPRFLSREANGLTDKHIGDVLGLQFTYEINRNISFDIRSSYFIAGKFIEATGESENTFYVAPTANFRF
ncbi:MAG: alginate export family protein [Bacteroidota bacterium]